MLSKSKKLYMIGNAHLDPVWLWQWQDGFHEAKATFRSALDRMNEYPDFIFVSSQAAIYEWVENSDPQMFAEIQQRVAEGRWKVVGGWWIEPDCNIPSGESFVRQGLYGQHYFKEKFGQIAKVGYCIDSFGHSGMLPQILKKSGMPYYVFMRPSPHEKGLSSRLFWWESDDGSRVLTFRIAYEYCSWGKDLRNHVDIVASELKDPQNELMCFYGVGNHGGGPTIENIESIHAMQEDTQLPELILSSPDEFFSILETRGGIHPVVHEDMQHHASGCYAAHSGVKRWNRMAENRLLAAEKFSVIARRVTGQPYSSEFGRAWKNVLFNQFHDILAGTSLEIAYDDARDQFGEALSIADRAMTYAVQALAWKINVEPEPGLVPVAIFNPHAWDVKTCIEIEISKPREEVVLLDSDNQPVPFQFIRSHATAGGRTRLCFMGSLPPMGYRLYRLVSGTQKNTAAPVEASQTVLNNGRYRLEFNPQTGAIHSLRDLQRNCELLIADGAIPVVLEDPSDTWSHNVFTFTGQTAGVMTARKIELIEHGPVKAVIRVTSEFGRSSMIQEFAMYNELDTIDVAVTIDWHEQQKMLKLRFPLNIIQMKATWEIPYGHIERMANGEEEPGQNWIDLSGVSRDCSRRVGISLLNDGKYSFDVNIRDMGMTLLRSPIYAHHMPLVPDPEQIYPYMDQGIQKFNYTIFPHAGSWDEAGTVRRAAELNQRPVSVVTTIHQGPLAHSASFVAVDDENVVVSVVKKAEDNDDLVVRCYETAGVKTTAHIHLPAWERTIEAHFGPCEIKTFRVPQDSTQPVIETNLLEWVD
jgi:alpha-mannosidase